MAMPGIPVSRLDSTGPKMPHKSPKGQPHTKPHKSTGRCMGDSRVPAFGIRCSAMGSTMQSAMHMAVITDFFDRVSFFMIISPFCAALYGKTTLCLCRAARRHIQKNAAKTKLFFERAQAFVAFFHSYFLFLIIHGRKNLSRFY